MITFNGQQYDDRHGGPFDRGSADSWYNRSPRPHYFIAGTYKSMEMEASHMTERQIAEYMAGYQYNEQYGGKKSWD